MIYRLPLTRGFVTLLDKEGYDKVKDYRWYARWNGYTHYAYRSLPRQDGKRPGIYLHRLLIDVPKGMQIDHINGDGLDNRRSNLRLCSQTQNNANQAARGSSGYKGVCLFRPGLKKPWTARICHHRKQIHLGYFETAEEAALAYNDAALDLFGEFAWLNDVGSE